MKTVTARELSHEGVSKVIAAAEREAVLVTRHGRPAAWIVGADLLGDAGEDGGEVVREVLLAVAVALWDEGAISLGRAARLLGLSIAEFVDVASQRGVPVLRRPPGGLTDELAQLEAAQAAGVDPFAAKPSDSHRR